MDINKHIYIVDTGLQSVRRYGQLLQSANGYRISFELNGSKFDCRLLTDWLSIKSYGSHYKRMLKAFFFFFLILLCDIHFVVAFDIDEAPQLVVAPWLD